LKRLAAIVLLLWTACFIHCSAEQYGVVKCDACPVQDCDSGGCPDSDSGEGESPCGVCDFLEIGGAPTITAPVFGAVDWFSVPDFNDFLMAVERARCYAGELSSKLRRASVGHQGPSLYTRLVSTSLPTRGPNA
jgi:hypothetical protein